jgi:Domain of unknown function (DUF4383)
VVKASPNRLAGWVGGGAFGILGLAGLVASWDRALTARDGVHLLGIELNGLQSAFHLAIGALLVQGARHRLLWTRFANTMSCGILLGVGLAGLAMAGSASLDVLAVNSVGNLLHIAAGLALLAISETRR